MHQGTTIRDMFVAEKMIVLTFLYFPNLDKVHQLLVINDFFTSFVNVYPYLIFPVPKRIDYLLKLCANNLRKLTPPSANIDGDKLLAIVVTVWSFHFLEFFRH
jgi:hypothetical protein